MGSSHTETDTVVARFLRMCAADARAVARLREEFSEWLRGHFDLDDVRTSDIILVVNEALSNAAEFAYRNRACADDITLQAIRRGSGDALLITVADRGEWRTSDAGNQSLARGRGIPLMRALTDEVEIDTSRDGTRVHLRFDRCPLRSDDHARLSA